MQFLKHFNIFPNLYIIILCMLMQHQLELTNTFTLLLTCKTRSCHIQYIYNRGVDNFHGDVLFTIQFPSNLTFYSLFVVVYQQYHQSVDNLVVRRTHISFKIMARVHYQWGKSIRPDGAVSQQYGRFENPVSVHQPTLCVTYNHFVDEVSMSLGEVIKTLT